MLSVSKTKIMFFVLRSNYAYGVLKFCLVVFYLVTQLYHISLDAGLSSIVWCSLSDPYAVMMTADGSIILLEFTLEGTEPKVKISRPQINQVSIQNKKADISFT